MWRAGRVIGVVSSGAQAWGRKPQTPAPVTHYVLLGGLGGYSLVAGLEGETLAVVEDPEVYVEFGPSGEGVEDAVLPYHLGYRGVLVLAPVPQDLLWGDVAPPELGDAETVGFYVGSEPPVVRHVGEIQPDLRQHPIEGQALEKLALLQLVQEVPCRKRRVDGHPAPQLYDLGVDHLRAELAGDGDPVVAVPDKVGVPDLVQANGRELL